MFTAGKDQWALDYMRTNWGAQTKLKSFNGAWQEGWNLPWGSTSHAWSSGPTALLPQKVLGLEPTGYGWKTFAVIPHMVDLKWAKGKVATVAGDISVAWRKTGEGDLILKLTVPESTQAIVYLPTDDLNTVKINGKPLAEMPAIKSRTSLGKNVILDVAPGTYQFECKIGGS
jgi:hypothetical protein